MVKPVRRSTRELQSAQDYSIRLLQDFTHSPVALPGYWGGAEILSDACRKPSEEGLEMPAEWDAHAGCYVSWPCRERTWQGFFREAKRAFADVIKAVNDHEPVTVLSDPSTLVEAQNALGPDVDVEEVRLDDSWIRDNGPIFVRSSDGKVAIVNFRFNGWGKFHPYDSDDQVPIAIAERLGMRRFDAPFVLEGGSISVDGRGTLLTTEQCLLNANRNPSLSREQIEQALRDYLGVRKILWLRRGQEDDLTDGHVDGVASFIGPNIVMAAYTNDESDPNFGGLSDNLCRLETFTDAKGKSIEVIKMMLPRRIEVGTVSVTPSYCNHYIANGAVVIPVYGIPEDDLALEILRSAHPRREVISVPGKYIEVGGGNVHCITQQRPSGEPLRPRPS